MTVINRPADERETIEREAIERRIGTLIRETCGADPSLLGSDACAGVYADTLRQALTSSEGGKRLRAMLVMAVFDALHDETLHDETLRDDVRDLACAIEVFQTAALVHDDIIDDSDMRRGRPSAHRALAETMRRSFDDVSPRLAASMGGGLGIMLGDLLATSSVAIVNGAASRMPDGAAIIDSFLLMHRDVEIGQVLDLAAERIDLNDTTSMRSNSLAVFRWKTASYTTIAPIRLGLLACGVDHDTARRLSERIGTPLGTAFQLADDLLDVCADPTVTGKPVGGDIREGKRTVLLADALDAAGDDDAAYLRRCFEAAGRDDDDVRRVIALFHGTGAVQRSRERITDLWRQSREAIEDSRRALRRPDRFATVMTDACARFIPADLRD
ncbi:polyprenyl synthetase family protein [Bifidobacterium simiarum]|uniref:Serralysin n=1 Tax=Bifidobacterium simiarum TaxID=2045441 RepID=A0A2M9HEJ9_9BIFI|nr:polyprenyl synthetase family protein [Bifidobacterium simiarum]PJM75250.1 serralysin [Bifidobacterium simiarum]